MHVSLHGDARETRISRNNNNAPCSQEWSHEPEEVKAHARSLRQNLLDAERAAAKWLKTKDLRDELRSMASDIMCHRREDRVLSANDFKAAWACLCRCSPQMETAALILEGDFKDCSDSEDSTYHPERDDMSVDAASLSSASSSSSSESEGLIVLGPDSDSECDEQEGVGETSVVEDREDDTAENASLIANALLESVAPPQAFNKLQVRMCNIFCSRLCTSTPKMRLFAEAVKAIENQYSATAHDQIFCQVHHSPFASVVDSSSN